MIPTPKLPAGTLAAGGGLERKRHRQTQSCAAKPEEARAARRGGGGVGLLRESVESYCGSPVGTIAACDPNDASPLNYDQVFIRDFVPSGIAFLLKGDHEMVRNFILHTLQLQRLAASCVWIAGKLEESPRRSKHIIFVFHRMECMRENLPIEYLDVFSTKYSELRHDLIRTERHLLKEMGFICHVERPHKFISNYLASRCFLRWMISP